MVNFIMHKENMMTPQMSTKKQRLFLMKTINQSRLACVCVMLKHHQSVAVLVPLGQITVTLTARFNNQYPK
jgi:hypothetical protein